MRGVATTVKDDVDNCLIQHQAVADWIVGTEVGGDGGPDSTATPDTYSRDDQITLPPASNLTGEQATRTIEDAYSKHYGQHLRHLLVFRTSAITDQYIATALLQTDGARTDYIARSIDLFGSSPKDHCVPQWKGLCPLPVPSQFSEAIARGIALTTLLPNDGVRATLDADPSESLGIFEGGVSCSDPGMTRAQNVTVRGDSAARYCLESHSDVGYVRAKLRWHEAGTIYELQWERPTSQTAATADELMAIANGFTYVPH